MSQPKKGRYLKLARPLFTKGTLLKKRMSFSVRKVQNIQNSLTALKFSVPGITEGQSSHLFGGRNAIYCDEGPLSPGRR